MGPRPKVRRGLPERRISQQPLVEFVAADDYEQTRDLVAVIRGIVGVLGSDPETTDALARIAREGLDRGRGRRQGSSPPRVGARRRRGRGNRRRAATTLWVASVYLAAFRRAAYRVHDQDPGPSWRARPIQAALTFLGLVALAIVAVALLVTKRLMREVGQAVGAEDATVAIWSIARWPLALLLVVAVTTGLYNLAPAGRRPGRVLSVGAVAAVLLWMLASAGFELWVDIFASYDVTYGALAGAVAFAIWLWISNLALLFGMVLDIELGGPGPVLRSP